jgi:hypothetical protein
MLRDGLLDWATLNIHRAIDAHSVSFDAKQYAVFA